MIPIQCWHNQAKNKPRENGHYHRTHQFRLSFNFTLVFPFPKAIRLWYFTISSVRSCWGNERHIFPIVSSSSGDKWIIWTTSTRTFELLSFSSISPEFLPNTSSKIYGLYPHRVKVQRSPMACLIRHNVQSSIEGGHAAFATCSVYSCFASIFIMCDSNSSFSSAIYITGDASTLTSVSEVALLAGGTWIAPPNSRWYYWTSGRVGRSTLL